MKNRRKAIFTGRDTDGWYAVGQLVAYVLIASEYVHFKIGE